MCPDLIYQIIQLYPSRKITYIIKELLSNAAISNFGVMGKMETVSVVSFLNFSGLEQRLSVLSLKMQSQSHLHYSLLVHTKYCTSGGDLVASRFERGFKSYQLLFECVLASNCGNCLSEQLEDISLPFESLSTFNPHEGSFNEFRGFRQK